MLLRKMALGGGLLAAPIALALFVSPASISTAAAAGPRGGGPGGGGGRMGGGAGGGGGGRMAGPNQMGAQGGGPQLAGNGQNGGGQNGGGQNGNAAQAGGANCNKNNGATSTAGNSTAQTNGSQNSNGRPAIGTVAKLGSNYITLTLKDGTTSTYSVTSDLKVMSHGENLSLAGISVGDSIGVKTDADGNVLFAFKLNHKPAPGNSAASNG